MRPLLFSTLSAWARQSALSSITRTRISDTRHALPLANQEVDTTQRSRRCSEAVSKVLQGNQKWIVGGKPARDVSGLGADAPTTRWMQTAVAVSAAAACRGVAPARGCAAID